MNQTEKRTIENQLFEDERALFFQKDLKIKDCVFEKGESPLKECANLDVEGSLFRWKYPFWYCRNVKLNNCTLFDGARSGIWYTNDVTIENSIVEAPKNLRRAKNIVLNNVMFPNAQETMWNCDQVTMNNVQVKGDYFAFNTNHVKADNLTVVGNYSFDGSHDVEVTNSKLISKDAFWNTENVVIKDSYIVGEYLGWNAKNLTLINCTIESLQGMCYVDNLVMKNCKLINTTLAFEYSTVDAQIVGDVKSILNPGKGTIQAGHVDTLIIQKDFEKNGAATIVCEQIDEHADTIKW